MIIFRPHRGSLYAAMAEAKEFNTVEEMKEHIVKLWHEGWGGSKELFTVDDIVINDARVLERCILPDRTLQVKLRYKNETIIG